MEVFKYLGNVISWQLFAKIPSQYENAFKRHIFLVNMQRFTTQSIVVVVMDIASLLVYLFYYQSAGYILPVHIAVHLVTIGVMLVGFRTLPKREARGYTPTSFFDRHAEIIYPLIHQVAEIALFFSGPQDLGALLRFLAGPFIVGGISIIKQQKAFIMELVIFIFFGFSLFYATPYGAFVVTGPYLLNLYMVVFPCVWLISFTVYSGFVNNFIYDMKEQQARKALAQANDQLDSLARLDQLTQLSNRRDFKQYMDETWSRHQESDLSVTAMMIDIDYFKRYNDRFGHSSGDHCLVSVTAAIKEQLDDNCMFARYGGEEFVAIIYGLHHMEAVELAEKIRRKIEQLHIENPDSSCSAYVTVSIGVATQAVNDLDYYNTIIDWADECLYIAKNNGRNRIIHTETQRTSYQNIDGERVIQEQNPTVVPTGAFEEEQMQRVLSDLSADCTFVYNRQQDSLTFSQNAVALFGTPNTLMHPTLQKIADYLSINPEDTKSFFDTVNSCIASREPFFSAEVRIVKRNQPNIWVSIRAHCSYNAADELDLIYGSVFNIQQMIQYNHYLQEQSMKNSITQLPNRLRFHNDIQALAEGPAQNAAILFLDIKNFKEINGVYSHSIGDKVLRVTAKRLERLTQNAGSLYNYAIDQFVCNVIGKDKTELQQLMETIHESFKMHPVSIDGLEIQVNFSIAAVEYTCGSTTVDTLMVDLDIAIHVVKFNQQNDAFFFTNQDRIDVLNRFNLNNELRQAIDNGFQGFSLHYQPIMNRTGQSCGGVEALLRWRNPRGDSIPPKTIIPILEQAGLMAYVEEWLINTACAQCRKWLDDGAPADFFMHINLSSVIIGRATLTNEILDAIHRHDLQLENIVLEITETSTVLEMQNVINTLKALRQQGIRVAIDDFGTGYSSLSYLNTLPADVVKIDRTFVSNIDHDPSRKDYLEAIIALSKSMGFAVCVEGIETQAEKNALSGMKFDYLQGYYFARPMEAQKFFARFLESSIL